MKKTTFLVIGCLFMCSIKSTGQVTYTALDTIIPNTTEFLYGTNPGYYNSNWSDINLSDIAKSAGVTSLRLSLPEWFLQLNGYNIRLKEFAHYQSIGMKNNTVFLDIYDPTHPDTTRYGGCPDRSLLFANLYEDIWDGGANGTPVNDSNYYALYVYKTVSLYKNSAKFWEIMNEPDYCLSVSCGDSPGVPGNWWDNPPDPCDLKNLKAPIFHYIRMLKISYEVIKTLDPTAYVCLGGIGYRSFLDGLLRYTDNPVDGSVTSEYPLKGGAYFDVVSYHCYPQYNLSTWNGNGFSYHRFSDAVADSVISFKNGFQSVLLSRGYNGKTYPAKPIIVTEYNIPRVSFPSANQIGSVAAQRNAIIKTLVKAQKNGISQLYTFELGDTEKESNASLGGLGVMGLYYNLTTNAPGQQVLDSTGVAFKATATFLQGYKFDQARTTAMNMPTGIEGAAFKNTANQYKYVLWARTKVDNSETATGKYSFPGSFALSKITTYGWNFLIDVLNIAAISSTNIPLSGIPIFVSEGVSILTGMEDKEALSGTLTIFPNPNTGQFTILLKGYNGDALLKIYAASGTIANTQNVQMNSQGISNINDLELPKGIYMAQIQTESQLFNQKLIIE